MVAVIIGILALITVGILCIVYACCKMAGDIDEIIGEQEGEDR